MDETPMAHAFFHLAASSIRNRPNCSAISRREKICKIDIMPATGRTIGAENFVKNRPARLSAAIANLDGDIFWIKRQLLQIAAVKKNAAGTSDVTSALCARKFGSNAARVSASNPPT